MKKALILLVLAVALPVMAQDKSTITIKNSEVNNGVVIIMAVQPPMEGQAKLSLELNCNKGASGCKAPEPGSYLMVRLPKNWGMYDCQNVDLYAASADPSTDQKIGEYCLNQK
jgi:hypothetical protein